MADPLSATASIIAVLQLTQEVLTGARKLYQGIKNASREVSELIEELTAFGVVLERLKVISHNAQQTAANGGSNNLKGDGPLPMLKTMMENGALSSCYSELQVFKSKINENSRLKSVKWPFQKGEAKIMIDRLRNLKSMLDTAISTDQL